MKILLTTDVYLPLKNGVVTSTVTLEDALISMGHDVKVLTLSRNGSEAKDGNKYYVKSFSLQSIYPDMRGTLNFRNHMLKELILWKPDIIHSQCEFFTMKMAKHISSATGARIVHTYHTMYDSYLSYVPFGCFISRKVFAQYICRKLKNADTIIAPTEKTKKALSGYGVHNPIVTIPTGLSRDCLGKKAEETERSSIRRAFLIPEDSFLMIYAGRLGTEKNVDELLLIFSWIYEDFPSCHLMITGDGPEKDYLMDLAAHLDICDRVHFTGFVEHNDIFRYYHASDIFVSASDSETQGLTYIEAMANGLPVLAKRDECLQGVVHNGTNGFQYESIEDFSRYLQLLMNENIRKNASEESLVKAEEFTEEIFASKVLEIYMKNIPGDRNCL